MEKELIDALKKTISAQDELIANLKEEIARLKAPKINFPVFPDSSPQQSPPWPSPVWIGTSPLVNPPFTVTCRGGDLGGLRVDSAPILEKEPTK